MEIMYQVLPGSLGISVPPNYESHLCNIRFAALIVIMYAAAPFADEIRIM